MNDARYNCPAPRCKWYFTESSLAYGTHQEVERVLAWHISTHRLYRHAMRFRVWRLRRWAARGDDIIVNTELAHYDDIMNDRW